MRSHRLRTALLSLALAAGHAYGGTNMIGGQSQNEGLLVLPKTRDVLVDGKLDEWDWSGRIWIFADKSVRNRFSAEISAMHDADALYLAAKWKDPTPMVNNINPEFNVSDGWKSDCIQMRFATADQNTWITTWYYTPEEQPVLHRAVWNDIAESRKGQTVDVYTAKRNADLGGGVQMAFKADEDGAGYVQEIRIPWKLIYKNVPAMAAGEKFKLGIELLWGDPSGGGWPIHRYADNVQPGHTHREFFWTNVRGWGDALLVDAGNVEPRQYISTETKLTGPIPIRLELPKNAATFSLAVDNAAGERVRNMGGLDPADYVIARNGETITVEVPWDAVADPQRNPTPNQPPVRPLVEAGDYKVRGIYHTGIGAEYEMSFYNPGTPPWGASKGSGGWGADHGAPLNVARAGEMMIVSWQFAEGGDGIIGIDANGRKAWGEKRGGVQLAADAEYVYAVPDSWHIKEEVLIRMNAKTGAYAPFNRDGKNLPFELPTREIFGGSVPGEIVGLAAGKPGLALAMSGGEVVVLNRDTTAIEHRVKLENAGALAFAEDGTLYVLAGGSIAAGHEAIELSRQERKVRMGGKLYRIDLNAGSATPVETPDVGIASDIDVDPAGNVLVLDTGADSQVKAFTPAGQPAYTCGAKGGRPIRGKFEPNAMLAMRSIASDAKGQVWVTENWEYPRRVSVWNNAGALVRDYIGNTGYAGTGAFLHETDPTLGYVGPVEIRLDKATRTWNVERILWVPDAEKGEVFPIDASAHVLPQRFASDASGKKRQYLFTAPYRNYEGYKFYMEHDDGSWKPVAAVTSVGQISGGIEARKGVTALPIGEWADLDPYDVAFWHDQNDDGIPQRAEATIVKSKKPATAVGKSGELAVRLGSGWGGRVDTKSFVFYTEGINAIRPTGFTAAGAPIYLPESVAELETRDRGDLVPVSGEDRVFCLSMNGYPNITDGVRAIDTSSGKALWTYPNLYPGVHGSHRATMPAPGLIIGALKITGYAKANDEVGNVLHIRGNLGQDFLLTADGLFAGTLFQDTRLPGLSLPDDESRLVGTPMEAFSGGGEPFNGWFGQQSDGKIRLTSGIAGQAAMVLRVTGLESLKRLPEVSLHVTAGQIEQAKQLRERQQLANAPKSGTIARAKEIKIDGKPDEWGDVPTLTAARGETGQRAQIRLAYDEANLYAVFEVTDDTPWKNAGRDVERLFKTGDSIDLQFSPTGNTTQKPVAGDVRLLVAPTGKGKQTVVIMKPADPTAPADAKKAYTSPVQSFTFDRVQTLESAKVAVVTAPRGYTVELSVPWADLGIKPEPGLKLTGDVGFTGSDSTGQITVSRTYWSNPDTNLVNDEPAEAMLYPHRWSTIELERF